MTTSGQSGGDERLGQVVAEKYRIDRLLGQGGMGSVYEAQHLVLGKRVALKFLHLSAHADATSVQRFQREARAISAVESAHIVQVFDWGQDAEGRPFLVMEMLEGRDLASRITQLGKIAVADAIRFATEAVRGLRRVHAAGIVHRDLKPENLLLVVGDDDRLHVKIVDFGLSKLSEIEATNELFERSARLTREGALVGTPLYMSPEQLEGADDVDHRADIWAIGVILHEMLAGAPPFMDRSYARLVMAICQRDPPDLRALNPAVSPLLANVVRRAMARDRAARFQTAEELLSALEPLGLEVSAVLPPMAGARPTSKTLPSEAVPYEAAVSEAPPQASLSEAASAESPSGGPVKVISSSGGGPLDATITAHTKGAATVWLTDAPVFSIWRGEVDSPDRLRIEARDGSIRDLRLEPVGELKLGRVDQVGAEKNQLVYPDVASRLAARLWHDGIRWWLERRKECSVPVQVGTRALNRGEAAPLVHGTFVSVGAMRATLVDRRYVSRSLPAGTVDPASGLLGRGGLEQEVATALQQSRPHGLVLIALAPEHAPSERSPAVAPAGHPGPVRVAAAIHRAWPGAVVARDSETVAMLVSGDEPTCESYATRALEVARADAGLVLAAGYWMLQGEAAAAGSEVELAFNAVEASAGPAGPRSVIGRVVPLRAIGNAAPLSQPTEVLSRARSPKHQMLLFGIEEQAALGRVGPLVVAALEQELAAIIATQAGPSALVTRLAPGIIGACIPRKIDAATLGVAVQCEWHARPPVTDGKIELPRTLSWEEALGDAAEARAGELSRECADPHGALSALSGGLPYPIAGRVHAAIGASSAVERVKMLFDVLEGTWRLIAVVLAAAYFAKGSAAKARPSQPPDPRAATPPPVGEGETDEHQAIRAFYERTKTRTGLPLGSWRELARIAAKGFEDASDPIGQLARQLLDVKLTPNQTFDQLCNLMHNERNSFAHGHYNEARAAADVHEFEQMTRTILRALRPLCAWTLVTVQRTEPDLYGESQTVEFIDHTGPYATGARRRLGFNSPIRLANVVYLARWRDGLVLPLEPFVRRLASDDRFELFWIDHLPRAGGCSMSAVVSGETAQAAVDPRRLPPVLRSLVAS